MAFSVAYLLCTSHDEAIQDIKAPPYRVLGSLYNLRSNYGIIKDTSLSYG